MCFVTEYRKAAFFLVLCTYGFMSWHGILLELSEVSRYQRIEMLGDVVEFLLHTHVMTNIEADCVLQGKPRASLKVRRSYIWCNSTYEVECKGCK
jgi:hypothetical protein